MTTPNTAKAAATKPAAKASPKVAEGKINHADCYAAKLHPATPAGRSLCRSVRAEGKPLTKKSFTAAAVKKAAPAKKPSTKKAETSSEDAMINLSMQAPAAEPEVDPFGDEPFDEADAATA